MNEDPYEFDGTLAGGDGRIHEIVMAVADGLFEIVAWLAVIGFATALVFMIWG